MEGSHQKARGVVKRFAQGDKRPRSEGTPKSNTADKIYPSLKLRPQSCALASRRMEVGPLLFPSLVSYLTHPRACDYLCGYSCHFNPQMKNAPNFKGAKEKFTGCTLF